MRPAGSNRYVLRAAVAAAIGASVLVCGMTQGARAQEQQEEEAFDVKILRNILKTLGLRRDDDGINYRERSPLVVPPSRDLVPPSNARASEKNPAWPNDPDAKRRKEAKVKRTDQRSSIDWDADSRALRPSDLRGNSTAANGPGQPAPDNVDLAGPMRPSELGFQGGMFSKIFGGPKEEYKTFTGEAPRASLIEPPPGYRTPSPNQPYGVGREKWTPPKFDRHEPVR